MKPPAGTHRPPRLTVIGDFNDEVGIDGLYLRDMRGRAHLYLSLVELSTTYHVCRRLKNREPKTVAKVFKELWVAGPPKHVRIDPGGMFFKEFQEAMDSMGISVKSTAGQASWQRGRVERHGGWLKLTLNRVVAHKSVLGKTRRCGRPAGPRTTCGASAGSHALSGSTAALHV